EWGGGFGAFGDAGFVEILAEEVDAVGTADVVEDVAVEVGECDAGGGLDEGADGEIFADDAAELEGDAVGGGELEVGEAFAGVFREVDSFGKTRAIELGKAVEGGASFLGDVGWRVVEAEELVGAVVVERNEPSKASAHSRVADEGRVFGAGELK